MSFFFSNNTFSSGNFGVMDTRSRSNVTFFGAGLSVVEGMAFNTVFQRFVASWKIWMTF